MSYEISLDPSRLDVDVIHGFLRESYWSPGIRRELVERAIQNSLVAGAYLRAGGAQVGFARAITDCATFGYLCDVFVLEQHRGQGLARAMVRALMDEPRVQTLRRWVLATRDAHAVYAQLGFVDVQPGRWMDKKMDDRRWQA